MKKAPQSYLVAKYVPDVRRMEPHNIGVVLWAAKRIGFRFLPEDDATFIDDKHTYRRWISYWTRLLSQDSISIRGNAPIPVSDPQYLTAFQSTQKGSYLLYDAGRVEDNVSVREVSSAVDFLFDELVAVPHAEQNVDQIRLGAESRRLLEDAGLVERVKRNHQIKCNVLGVPQQLSFNYAVDAAEDSARALMQRVVVSNQQSLTSAAFKFEWLGRNDGKAGKCASIVYVPTPNDPAVASSLKILRSVSTVLNLAQYDDAVESAKRLAA